MSRTPAAELSEEMNYFMGECNIISTFLDKKPNYSKWIIAKFIDALFRGFSQVYLCNNPITGAVILVSMAVVEPYRTLGAVLATAIALVVSVLIQQPQAAITNGLTGYNPVLIGFITVSNMPAMFEAPDPTTWLFFIAAVIFCVYVTVSLSFVLGKLSLPCLTLPFNVMQYFILISLAASQPKQPELIPDVDKINFVSVTDNTSDTSAIDWGLIFAGIVTSSGQVVGVYSVVGSALIYGSILIFSPTMAGFSFLGAFLGTITATLFNQNSGDLLSVYEGVWGYNGLLCGAALGGFFYINNIHTSFATIMSILFSTVLQVVIGNILVTGLTVQTFPFCLSAMLFLCLTAEQRHIFPKANVLSYPEKHRREYCKNSPLNKSEESVVSV